MLEDDFRLKDKNAQLDNEMKILKETGGSSAKLLDEALERAKQMEAKACGFHILADLHL